MCAPLKWTFPPSFLQSDTTNVLASIISSRRNYNLVTAPSDDRNPKNSMCPCPVHVFFLEHKIYVRADVFKPKTFWFLVIDFVGKTTKFRFIAAY